jgi:hypothetical protein
MDMYRAEWGFIGFIPYRHDWFLSFRNYTKDPPKIETDDDNKFVSIKKIFIHLTFQQECSGLLYNYRSWIQSSDTYMYVQKIEYPTHKANNKIVVLPSSGKIW